MNPNGPSNKGIPQRRKFEINVAKQYQDDQDTTRSINEHPLYAPTRERVAGIVAELKRKAARRKRKDDADLFVTVGRLSTRIDPAARFLLLEVIDDLIDDQVIQSNGGVQITRIWPV